MNRLLDLNSPKRRQAGVPGAAAALGWRVAADQSAVKPAHSITTKVLASDLQAEDVRAPQWRRRMVTICLVIFLMAIGVRLFHWQDNRPIFTKLFTGMIVNYKAFARPLTHGDLATFVTGPAPPGDANILTYPPGYPLILGVVFKLFGESDAAMRLFQIICDAGSAVLLFLIAAELVAVRAAAIAGAMTAVSPQLAYYSVILIPDSLATLPILLAIYFIIRAKKSNSFPAIVAAGVFVGVSCWLRSNALFMAPFLAVVLLVTIDRARRWRYALTLVASTILVIAPITIRNLVVFHHFIPLSLGVGQMLSFGITDFDKDRRYGLPGTDIETVRREAAEHNRPDYGQSLFGGNGVERDRQRTARALAVVRAHPIWFGGVVLRRAASMLRLERVHRLATTPGVMSRLEVAEETQPVWSGAPAQLVGAALTGLKNQPLLKVSLSTDGQALIVESDAPDLRYQIVSLPITVEKNTDYLLRVPVLVERGSVVIETTNSDQTERYGSTPVLSPLERIKGTELSLDVHEIVFVSRDTDQVFILLDNAGRRGEKIVARLGKVELFRLGPASFQGTRYVRALIHFAQRFFLTAWMLPLALIGLGLLLLAGRGRDILLLLAIPAYYLCFQSFLHTEYRYVLAAQPFLYVMAGVTLYFLWLTIWRMVGRRRESNS